MNLLDNPPNQRTKFRTKSWVGLYDESHVTITLIVKLNLRSSLCDCSDAYIRGTIIVAALAVRRGNNNIHLVFKKCTPFNNCIRKINSSQIDHAKNIDVVMSSESSWQFYRYERALTYADALNYFPVDSALFKFKQKIAGSTGMMVQKLFN